MGKETRHLSIADTFTGRFGGTPIGSAFGGGSDKLGAMVVGGMIGTGLSMIAGSAIHVYRYMGIVDI